MAAGSPVILWHNPGGNGRAIFPMTDARDNVPAERAAAASDIRTWLDRVLPAAARPYARLMRLDRPIGTWLLLFPCWWGLFLALSVEAPNHLSIASLPPSRPWVLLGFMVLFAIGAMVMRGAGCTYNDIVDRDFDAKVARTALRPIPSGQVSVRQAMLFLVAQLLVGLLILLTFNRFTILLGVLSLALVFTYPLMKRVTHWPQAFLGLTFNWGALMGWTAVTGNLGLPAFALYAGGIAWTLHYDTIYAHQDKEDDALIGVKSTALKLGAQTKPWLAGFSVATIVLFEIAAALAHLGWPAMLAVAAVALHLTWQILTVDLDDPADCLAKFRSNRWIGWLLLIGIIAGQLLA
jgi:4-hydroxybenzoate polyprenyltransferase